MSKSIPLSTAITLSLGDFVSPVITKYQFAHMIYLLYIDGQYHSQKIKALKGKPSTTMMSRQLKVLLDQGILSEKRPCPHKSVFSILGKGNAEPADIICSVDPFAYLSHSTAMEYHGLTDRFPKIIFVSSPPPKKWPIFARSRMEKDLGNHLADYLQQGFPKLTRINLDKIDGQSVHRYSSIHLGAFKKIQRSVLRVATIGRTFLDMLRRPDLCGGIYHVIDCYKEHASTYLWLIIDEFLQHGTKIDKIRAGYILEEVCALHDQGIEDWQQFVQRGGSMKLDPTAEYSPTFSERWNLSINILQ